MGTLSDRSTGLPYRLGNWHALVRGHGTFLFDTPGKTRFHGLIPFGKGVHPRWAVEEAASDLKGPPNCRIVAKEKDIKCPSWIFCRLPSQ